MISQSKRGGYKISYLDQIPGATRCDLLGINSPPPPFFSPRKPAGISALPFFPLFLPITLNLGVCFSFLFWEAPFTSEVLNRRWFCLPRDAWQYLETCLADATGWNLLVVGGGRGCCYTSYSAQDSLLQPQNYSAESLSSVEVEKLCVTFWGWQEAPVPLPTVMALVPQSLH